MGFRDGRALMEIDPGLANRVLAGTVRFNGMAATAAIHRYLTSIDEPDRPVIWVFRETDVVALLAGTSAHGVARSPKSPEWLPSHGPRTNMAAHDAALRDIRDWRIVAAHLMGAGVPSHIRDDAAMIAAEGIAADATLQTLTSKGAGQLAKRLTRMIATRDVARAGVWAMWLTGAHVVAMPRPVVRYRDGEPHAEDGPAIKFPGGMAIHAWNGGYVPEPWVIARPSRITPETIIACRDGRVGTVALERYGWDRFVVSRDSVLVSDEPAFGRLFRRAVRWRRGGFAAVEVLNATPELDGTRRRHILAVPPHMNTAREAVAWTFGLDAHEYRPDAET